MKEKYLKENTQMMNHKQP